MRQSIAKPFPRMYHRFSVGSHMDKRKTKPVCGETLFEEKGNFTKNTKISRPTL